MIAVRQVESVADVGTAEHWAPLVAADWRASVAAIVATGRRLLEAEKACGHGEYGRLFKGHKNSVIEPVPFSERTSQRLRKIAKNPLLANPTHGSDLPASWRTLAELSRLKPKRLLAEIKAGRVHPEMERSDALALVAKAAGEATGKPVVEVDADSTGTVVAKVERPLDEVMADAVKDAINKNVGKLRTLEQFQRVREMLERMLRQLDERQSKQIQGEHEPVQAERRAVSCRQ